MAEPEYLEVHDYIPVPKIFYPFLEDHPFEKCIVCSRYLLESGVQYCIEKGFKGKEVIFEYSMCYKCRKDLGSQLSKESIMRIGAWWDERIDMAERREKLLKQSGHRVDEWISKCVLTGDSRDDLDAYQIYGECDGTDLLFSYYPFMLGCNAMGQLAKLMSKKTRDCIDDFTGEYLGMPPELVDLPEDTLVFIP